MKNFIILIAIILTCNSTYAQQDTIVYYKNHTPIASSNGADQQVVIQQNNRMSSIMMTCSWKDNKWKVDKTEIIKLKKDGSYKVSNGTSHYMRSYKKIKDGYEVQEFNHEGKLRHKGLSRNRFPLHRVGQWQNLHDNKVVGISIYKEEAMIKSYIIANDKHLPTNTYANADSLAIYKDGEDGYEKAISETVEYPRICQENGITGRVLVLFAIDVNGSPSEIQILKGADHHLNVAAATAVKSCKDWTPAFKDGKPVKLYQIAPIDFELR